MELESLHNIKSLIDSASSKDDIDEQSLYSQLQYLHEIKINEHFLRTTKIGISLNNLIKSGRATALIRGECRALLRRWKSEISGKSTNNGDNRITCNTIMRLANINDDKRLSQDSEVFDYEDIRRHPSGSEDYRKIPSSSEDCRELPTGSEGVGQSLGGSEISRKASGINSSVKSDYPEGSAANFSGSFESEDFSTSKTSDDELVKKPAKRNSSCTQPPAGSVRDGFRSVILKALTSANPSAVYTQAVFAPADVEDLASEIENEIYKLSNNETNQKYKNLVRSRASNLKDKRNTALLAAVLEGKITPARLAAMTHQEMASEEMKSEIKKISEETTREHFLGQTTGTPTDMFLCSRCKKRFYV